VEREPVSISELSAAENVTLPTMSRTVSALQSRDLVHCVLDDADKRSVRVVSTAKGRSALRKGLNHSLTVIASLLEGLEQDALEAMRDLILASQGKGSSAKTGTSSPASSE
jgi:DNA-binding MarR family transcriptional regulator